LLSSHHTDHHTKPLFARPAAMLYQHSRAGATAPSSSTATCGRRTALLSAIATAVVAAPRPRPALAAGATTPPEDASSELIQTLLAKSNAPGVREQRAKERLEAYNDKIYGEGYFEVEIGQGAAKARGISDETAAAIQAWNEKREARLAAKGR
jgi:hypothetical protein